MAFNYRNVGLGIMGLHDLLCKLGMKYGDEESKEFIDSLMHIMFQSAVIKSSQLAKERGSFPKYTSAVLASNIIRNHFTPQEIEDLGIQTYGLRNCSLLSIAPSGSIGTMLNISTGCEPFFRLSYKRKTESLNNKDEYYDVYVNVVKEYMNVNYTEELPEYFNTSSQIKWHDRVDIQSVLQKHVDTAISSTINLPNEIKLEEVEKLYLYAWEKGLKGITIYRDGCSREGILTTNVSKKDKELERNEDSKKLERGMIIKADDNCVGRKKTLHTGCGTLHCEAFFDPDTGDLLETYFSKGSSGGCNNFMIGLSRMISLAARGGIDIYSIVDQLKSSGTCPSYAVRTATKHDTSKGSSCPVAIGNALLKMYEEMKKDICEDETDEILNTECVKSLDEENIDRINLHANKCPECGGNLVFEGGCNTCKDCGWSKCD